MPIYVMYCFGKFNSRFRHSVVQTLKVMTNFNYMFVADRNLTLLFIYILYIIKTKKSILTSKTYAAKNFFKDHKLGSRIWFLELEFYVA